MIREAIADLATGRSLGYEGAHDAMAEIMDGQASPAQIGAFLLGFRMKGEGPDEIAGMATAMRERCAAIRPPPNGRVVDLCGTGGAPLTTFNVSTIAMFVVAAAGVVVAKHGNRAITSHCGSADLLEALGISVDLEPAAVERTALLCVEGENDDICAVGQTKAALDLCTGIPAGRKAYHLQHRVGHFGVFNGRRWREEIFPKVRDFIRANG